MSLGLSAAACMIWWFVAGLLGGWLLYWLLDKTYMRDSANLGALERDSRAELTRANARYHALRDDYDNGSRAAAAPVTDDNEVRKLRAEIETLSKASSNRSEEVAKLKGELASSYTKDTEISKLKTELVAARNSAGGELSSIQGLLSTTKTDLETAKRTAQQNTSDLSKLRAELDAAKKADEAKVAEAIRLRAEIETTKKAVAAATAAAAAQADDLAKARRDLQAASAKDTEIAKLRSEVTASKEGSTKELSSVQGLLSTTKTDLETAKRTAQQHSTDLSKLRAELDAAKKADEAKVSEANRLRAEIETTKKAVAAATAAAAAQADDLAKVRRDLQAASAKDTEIAKLRSEVTASKEGSTKELSSVQGLLSTTKTDLETAKRTAQQHSADLAKLRAELDAAKKADEAKVSEANRLRAEIETTKKAAATHEADKAKLVAALDAAKKTDEAKSADVSRLKADVDAAKKTAATHADEVSKLKRDLAAAAAKDAEITKLKLDLSAAKAAADSSAGEAAKLKRDLSLVSVQAAAATSAAASISAAATYGFVTQKKGADDLEVVEGIGPKIADKLRDGGITTFAKLAASSPAQLRDILEKAGPAFRIAVPDSWPTQADLIVKGRWEDLRKLQDELEGGVKPKSDAEINAEAKGFNFVPRSNSKDDLTIIEGIGPKIAELLVADGIDTFAKLGNASADRIQKLLDKGGPNFRLAVPNSWPGQAQLAARGKWQQLRTLQDELDGGIKAKSDAEVLADAAPFGFVPRVKGKDDLLIIEGVGPKIAELLMSAGIDTFQKLANANQEALKSVLEKGGKGFQMANPQTWPEQASLCVKGKWDELKKLQDQLVAGNRPTS